MMECGRAWIERPRLGILGAIVGALFMIAAMTIWWQFQAANAPVTPTLLGQEVRHRADGGSWLILTMHSPPTGTCVRTGLFMISRSGADGVPDYIPLGSSLNGQGYNSRPGTFRFWLDLNSDFAPGEWQFVYRIHYGCRPMEMAHFTDMVGPVTIRVP